MSEKTKQAIQMYRQACRAEQEGKATLAESYYIRSGALFEEAGETSGAQYVNAAKALNALTFLRWSRQDYEGALHSAKESVKIMETYGTQSMTSAEGTLIYNTSCVLMDQMQHELLLISGRTS